MTLSRVTIGRGVATITLDSPANRNALGMQLTTELLDHLRACTADDAVRVIVIEATGTVFSAGWDLDQPPAQGLLVDEVLVEALEAIRTGPKPVVAKVAGHAVGGALGLVAACDISVASTRAKFGFGEVRLGLAPTTAAVLCVPKMRLADALELLLTGERFTAEQAVQVGIVNRAVAPEQLDAEVAAIIGALLLGGPIAMAACKQLARGIAAVDAAAYSLAARYNVELVGSPEAMEGIAAFTEQRPPSWVDPTWPRKR